MVRPVEEDARGIIAPDAGLAHFRLDRYPPGPAARRFVDRYWVASWDLRGRDPYTQQVLAHPVVNVVVVDGAATVHGVTTRIGARTLAGAGRALGIMFRPAGFRPFLGGSMAVITGRELPLAEVIGPSAARLREEVEAAATPAEAATVADAFLAGLVPPDRQPSEDTTLQAERAAADPGLVRVADLAALAGLSPRQLQRRFADHVGISAKALIRRYRLYQAAERTRAQQQTDWAALAAELGYSDQSHLTREFTALIGLPPERYARACRQP